MRELPPRARAYVASVALLAAAILVTSIPRLWAGDRAWQEIAGLFLLQAAVSRMSTRASDGLSVSVGFIVALASVALVGAWGAAVVATAVIFTNAPRLVQRVFNAAQFVVASFVTGLVWALVLGDFRLGDQSTGRILFATAAATIVFYLLNNTFVAIVVALVSRLSLRRVWTSKISWLTLNQLGYGVFGLLMAEMYRTVGLASAALLLAPLLVARKAFANYAELRNAYDGTVSALVQAVETKDYYTRGHSERVARVTEMIAREWGMREDRVQVIKIAGMLHDVGKLGVSTRVLQKQGKLNQLEFEAIKIHPLRGYEMLSEIDFLSEAISGVYHHHERMDGRGYPLGLSGDEIPEFARIIMTADAFDSMTSTRSYREAKTVAAAIVELRRCQGTQFDEKVVDCLVAVVEKYGWAPHPEDYFGEQVDREGRPIARSAAAGGGGSHGEGH